MKIVEIGSKTTVANCPIGLFSYRGQIAFKRKMSAPGADDQGYLIESGKPLRHDLDYRERLKLIVQPLRVVKG
ncbi:MAG TPA: hypothetical protein VG347_04295 [Verrucomicrobiae bacterium]|nr:hypothetical protein [Verrucomicrobiae bacterium]